MEHLSPVPESVLQSIGLLHPNQLGRWIAVHTEMDGIPDLEDDVKVAIIGVKEDRRSYLNTGCAKAPDEIRKKLYELYCGEWDFKVADLGNLYRGERYTDTLKEVQDICSDLVKKGIITIILGGSQDITYANYRAYDSLEQTVNIAAVDSRLDIGSEGRDLDHQSYVSHLVMQKPHNLYNFTNIGYQTYFNNPEEIELIEKLFFEAHRLGKFTGKIHLTEPLVRDTDILSMDISAVKQSYSPGTYHSSPHGFTGEDFCTIARYAGMSDRLSAFGIYEYNPTLDVHGASAHLCAHTLWYFLEGISLRVGDYPIGTKDNYQRFTVMLDAQEDLIFFKSPHSNRWWIEVPKGNPSEQKTILAPCAEEDYKEALSGRVPTKWWKAGQKGL